MLPFETLWLNLLFLKLNSLICYPLKIYRASNVVYVFLFLFFYIAKLNEFFAFFWGGEGLK